MDTLYFAYDSLNRMNSIVHLCNVTLSNFLYDTY